MPGRPKTRAKLGLPGMDKEQEMQRLEAMRLAAQGRPPKGVMHPATSMDTGQVLTVIEGELVSDAPIYPPPPRDRTESYARLDQHGIGEYLDLLTDGLTQAEICKRIGTRPAHLVSWLASQPQFAGRVREARRAGAQAWLDRSFQVLDDADSLTALAQARELSAVCRKYAAILDPGAYSDRMVIDAKVEVAEDPATIDAKLKLLLTQIEGNRD